MNLWIILLLLFGCNCNFCGGNDDCGGKKSVHKDKKCGCFSGIGSGLSFCNNASSDCEKKCDCDREKKTCEKENNNCGCDSRCCEIPECSEE